MTQPVRRWYAFTQSMNTRATSNQDEFVLATDYLALEAERDALRADARRYRWLRTRINWSEVEGYITTNRTAPALKYTQRNWTHVDYRPNRPDSEHIDEYIDSALATQEAG